MDPSFPCPSSCYRVQRLCQRGADECGSGSGAEQCHHQRSAEKTGEMKMEQSALLRREKGVVLIIIVVCSL